jgi:protein-tyrosine phosphatase
MSSDRNALTLHLRRVARTLRHTPDRALHPLRRRNALKRVRRLGLPRSVLFVCHGNICRSPYAEKVFFRCLPWELQDFMIVASVGFTGPNRPPPRNALTVAAERGIDLRSHRSRLLSHEIVGATELIVVMDARQRDALCRSFGADPRRVLVLGDLDPLDIDTRLVRDPIFQPCEVFADSYARIDRCVVALLGEITGSRVALPFSSIVLEKEAETPERGAPERAEVA